MNFSKGDMIEMDGLLGVVVGAEDDGAPEDHLMVWFGEPRTTRASQGGATGTPPIATIPRQPSWGSLEATAWSSPSWSRPRWC